MITTIEFNIRLTSDGEPGTGLGGQVLNERIPRDHHGRPILPASHVKGLMRAAFQEIAASLDWQAADELERCVFGMRDERRPGVQSAFRLSDATSATTGPPAMVTRTAIDPATGVARDAALRTAEILPVGMVFRGKIHTAVPPDSAEDLVWRLALMAIPAIGGNRNRGGGACVVEIDGDRRGPGTLLQELAACLSKGFSARPIEAPADPAEPKPAISTTGLSDKAVVLRLVFRASTQICCPEIADKTNVIATGFSIPASAVQGAILNRLNAQDPALAAAVFESPLFRAWPLHPCHPPLADNAVLPAELPVATRVSLTHRVAKFSEPDDQFVEKHFFDECLESESYDWRSVAGGAPLKASDGVLLRWDNGDVRLWKAGSMPHVITAHGVHNDPETESGRNLFSIDAMAPMVWQGLVVMPEDAASRLHQSLDRDPVMAFGKSRSVRGMGHLSATVLEGVPAEWQTHTPHTVLVVQSPVLLPDHPPDGVSAEEELFHIVSGWAREHGLPEPAEDRTWANFGIRFGWNRHEHGRQQASRVVLPGSVIAFPKQVKVPDADLSAALRRGIGPGRHRGFGAMSVHPGKATGLYAEASLRPVLPRRGEPRFRDAMQLVLKMKAATGRLPSPSQIRAVQQRLLKSGCRAALDYLDRQTRRTSRIWFTWEPIHSDVKQLLNTFDDDRAIAVRALEVLADLAMPEQEERR